MRALLAPLTRWLDRRIDARVTGQIAIVREQRAQDTISIMRMLRGAAAPAPSSGPADLTAEAAQDIRAVTAIAEADDRVTDRPRDDRWMGA